jgi:hypothetical protein
MGRILRPLFDVAPISGLLIGLAAVDKRHGSAPIGWIWPLYGIF